MIFVRRNVLTGNRERTVERGNAGRFEVAKVVGEQDEEETKKFKTCDIFLPENFQKIIASRNSFDSPAAGGY